MKDLTEPEDDFSLKERASEMEIPVQDIPQLNISSKKEDRKRKREVGRPDLQQPERHNTRSMTLKDTSFTKFCTSEVERTQVMFLEKDDLHKIYHGLVPYEVKCNTFSQFSENPVTYMKRGDWKEWQEAINSELQSMKE